MKIIGFSGRKQSGKTSAAEELLPVLGKCDASSDHGLLWARYSARKQMSTINDVAIVNFADALKDIVGRLFDIPGKDLHGSDGRKNRILPCGKSIREVLQIVGTDWFRTLDPDYWVMQYDKTMRGTARVWGPDKWIILTADVRFPNEVHCIQQQGGHVIRLLRAPFAEDAHKSETALDDFEGFDAVIDNREMTEEQKSAAIMKVITEKEWL